MIKYILKKILLLIPGISDVIKQRESLRKELSDIKQKSIYQLIRHPELNNLDYQVHFNKKQDDKNQQIKSD